MSVFLLPRLGLHCLLPPLPITSLRPTFLSGSTATATARRGEEAHTRVSVARIGRHSRWRRWRLRNRSIRRRAVGHLSHFGIVSRAESSSARLGWRTSLSLMGTDRVRVVRTPTPTPNANAAIIERWGRFGALTWGSLRLFASITTLAPFSDCSEPCYLSFELYFRASSPEGNRVQMQMSICITVSRQSAIQCIGCIWCFSASVLCAQFVPGDVVVSRG